MTDLRLPRNQNKPARYLRCKDGELPAVKMIGLYILLSLGAFLSYTRGSMTAFVMIRDSFSDLWESVSYACNINGYLDNGILYPPASSVVLLWIGKIVSNCSLIVGSRKLTLICYGAIGLGGILGAYFYAYYSFAKDKIEKYSKISILEIFALSCMCPPFLFGLTRMNTTLLVVPIAMAMIIYAENKSYTCLYIALAILPLVKPTLVLIGLIYCIWTFGTRKAIVALLLYAVLYAIVNNLIFSLVGYNGGIIQWARNILLFGSQASADWRTSYYSYNPLDIDYVNISRFLVVVRDVAGLEVNINYTATVLASTTALASICYTGFAITKCGLQLYKLKQLKATSPSCILCFALLATSYILLWTSKTAGAYSLSIVVPLIAYFALMNNAMQYRKACCILMGCSLYLLLPINIIAWSAKFPTIVSFAWLSTMIAKDIIDLNSSQTDLTSSNC